MLDKACDACRERRVKCPRGDPCLQCLKADVQCSYLRISKRKGPTGKVITRLRQRAHRSIREPVAAPVDYDAVSSLALPDRSTEASIEAGPSRTPYSSDLENYLGFALTSPPNQVPTAPATTHWLSPWLASKAATLHALLDDYFDRIHPLRPIVNVESTKRRFLSEEHLYEMGFAALVLSLAALAAIVDGEGDTGQADLMITEAMALHNRTTLGNGVNLDTIATSMSIAAYVGARHGRNAAFVRTREAISLLQLLKLDQASTYREMGPDDVPIGLTMLWLLSGIERSAALFDLQTLVLRKRPSEISSSVDISQDELRVRLPPVLSIYDTLDGQIVDCINGLCVASICGFNGDRAVHLHHAIDDVNADPALKRVQMADFLVTRLWIHTKLWLASLTHSLLFPPISDSCLALDYPLRLLEDTKKITAELPVSAFHGNGQSMGYKIDHIASVAETVMSYQPVPGMLNSSETTQETINSLRRLGRELQDKLRLRREIPDDPVVP